MAARPVNTLLGLLFTASLLPGLSGCVTETTGGFNVEVSEEQALHDYIALARGYLEQGDLLASKRHLENAANLDRNNSEVHAIWGLVYAREGESELADENFRRSLRIDGGNSQARNNYAAFLFAEGRFEEAYRQLERVVADTAYPARAQAFENLGLAALRLDRPDDAERAFSRAVQLNRNQLRSILELVGLNLAEPDLEQARGYYDNYLTLLNFYNLRHSARSLWLGIQLSLAQRNETEMLRYAAQLEGGFKQSPEYRLYQQLMDKRSDD